MGTIDRTDAPTGGMTWRDDLAIAAPILLLGVALFAAASLWLLTRDERGGGMLGLAMTMTPAFIIGVPFGLGGLGELVRHLLRDRRLPVGFCCAAAIGLPCLLLPGVAMLGGQWHRADVAEAKAFIDRRVAAARAVDATRWPRTQADFVSGEPIPRALRRERTFYQGSKDGTSFEIWLRVDWGSSWGFSSDNPAGRLHT